MSGSAIFGSGAPKIIDSGANTVNFDYCWVLKDGPELDREIHTEKFSGHREINVKGRRWVFECEINLWKYAVPATSYNTFKGLLYDSVTLYRHRDGNPVQYSSSNVDFFIEAVNPFYLENLTAEYDKLFIRLVSEQVIDDLGLI